MIVQSTRSPGEAHLVLTMEQHTATAGALADHFGGVGPFAPLEPRDLLRGLAWEHDRGWAEVDAAAPRDPSTDLPWSVYQTPTSVSIGTGPRSIDHNERCHPYRGLLSSMHIAGLFTGRFGLDDTRILDQLGPESRALLEPMLAAETTRPVIVAYHQGTRTVGLHPPQLVQQQKWEPLFLKYKVRLALQGHNHSYERIVYKGLTYVTSGGGGYSTYPCVRKTAGLVMCKSVNHFLTVDVTTDAIDVTAIDAKGKVIDRFEIPLTAT